MSEPIRVDGLLLIPLDQRLRYRVAAETALRRWPGRVGELIHRELSAYAERGHRFADEPVGLVPRSASR